MGIVYEAYDRKLQDRVALKTVRRRDPDLLYRLKREFRAVQGVTHANLVELGELIEESGWWFFTMELIHGEDFVSYVRTSEAPLGFDEPLLRSAAAQLAAGLHALHTAGRVHRDVKPSNALVTREGRVVLLDFGLAVQADADTWSAVGDAPGTTLYLAPELALSPEIEPSADWYSFGVVLYQALTGKLPHTGQSFVDIMGKKQYAPLPPRARTPTVPPDLDELCIDLLATDPNARPTGEIVLERLGLQEASRGPRAHRRAGTASERTQSGPFVGRETELASMRAAFEEMRRGSPQVVSVCGESGLGKTALLRALAKSLLADQEDVVLLIGRCYERESVPYKAFDGIIDALSRYMRALRSAECAALVPAHAALLPRVFPVLGRVEAVASAPRVVPAVEDPHELRARVFAALRHLIYLLAERHPLVLVIDDMQWADPDSLLLLSELLRPPDPPPLLLVVASRPDAEIEDTAAPAFARGVTHHLVGLGPLPESEGALMARLLLHGDPRGAQIDPLRIAREAGGNPLFIDELVRHVEPVEQADESGIRLEAAIWKRASALAPPSQELLAVIALAGAPLPESTFGRAASLEEPALGRAVTDLRVANLIRTGRGRGTRLVEPYHDRVRAAVLEHLPPAARRGRHDRLARALEATGAVGERPELLLRHLERSGNAERAAEVAEEAATRASQALAFDRAAELYATAIRLGCPTGERLRSLRVAMGDAMANAGRCAEAATVFAEASSGANPAARLDCQRKAAQQYLNSGHIESGLDILHEVLREVGVSMARTPRGALASLLLQRLRLRLRGLEWKERHESQVAPDQLKRVDVFRVAAVGLGMVDNVPAADFQSRSLRLALECGERSRVAVGLCHETVFVASQGTRQLTRARRLLDAARHAASTSPTPYVEAWLETAAGTVHYFAGEFSAATTHLLAGERAFRERTTGSVWEHNSARIFRMLAMRPLGAFAELRTLFQNCVREAAARGNRYAETTARRSNSFLHLVANEPDRVADELARATWVAPGRTLHIQHWHELEARAEHSLYIGATERAPAEHMESFARLDRSLLPRVQVIRTRSHWLRARLLLAAAATDRRDATALLRSAARSARRLLRERIDYASVWAHLLRAAIALQRGDDQGATTDLHTAVDGAEESQMHFLAAAARHRLGELIGGDEGARLIAEATSWMTGEGVVNPARMLEVVAPGFARPGAGLRED